MPRRPPGRPCRRRLPSASQTARTPWARHFTGDHVLDLWIEADGTGNVKDSDELEEAEKVGLLHADETSAIQLNAEHGRASLAARDWP